MTEITLQVWRPLTSVYTHGEDETVRKELHIQRAKLLHEIADVLALDVKDWENTDSAHPYEHVEIKVVIDTIELFTALITLFAVLVNNHMLGPRRGIEKVYLVNENGRAIINEVRDAVSAKVSELAQAVGLSHNYHPTQQPPQKKNSNKKRKRRSNQRRSVRRSHIV